MKNILIPALFFLCGFAATSCQKSEAPKEELSQVSSTEKKEDNKPLPEGVSLVHLKLSEDGTAIMDENGNEVAKFNEDYQVKPSATQKSDGSALAIPGCMCCKKECIAYDNKGNCIKWYNSCTWSFDCKCN
jgi:hypothetical protein